MMPTETIGLVIEKMRKMLSCAIGALAAGFCRPISSNQPIWPRRATITVAPGRVPLSTSRLNASDIRCRRVDESPICSGLAWGREGVCGAAACLAAVWAFMVSPVALVVGRIAGRLSGSLNENGGLEQVGKRVRPCNRGMAYA